MFKNRKKKVMLAALTALALGNIMSVSAATDIDVNYAEYKGYVMKNESLVTDSLFKTTHDDGTNRVIFVEENASLCSWIDNYIGLSVTDKVNYTSGGAFYMKYTQETDVEHPGPHLATELEISTRWYEFDNAYTNGIWSPDTF